MNYTSFDAIAEVVRANPIKRRVVLVSASDEHSLEALKKASQDGIVEPLLVGCREKIMPLLEKLEFVVPDENIFEAKEDSESAAIAVKLVREGMAEVLMKGKLQTADLLRAVVAKELGLRTDSLISHFAMYQIPGYHKLIALTDGGMIPFPDLEQKIQILMNAVNVFHSLGNTSPKVAVLGAIEVENPRFPESVDGARLKAMNVAGELQGCLVEGPISYDLAMSPEAAEIKGYSSPVTGDVDILLVPTMSAGNILGKALVYHCGAIMAGIVIGAKAPIVLTSRGSSVVEKYCSLVLSAAVSMNRR
jgi:phosphate butyryltransferase